MLSAQYTALPTPRYQQTVPNKRVSICRFEGMTGEKYRGDIASNKDEYVKVLSASLGKDQCLLN